MADRKIKKGNRYDIKLKLHREDGETTFEGMYYMGPVRKTEGDGLCCSCCGRDNMKLLHQFRMPKGNASFDECRIICYTDELYVGSSCAGRIGFKPSEH